MSNLNSSGSQERFTLESGGNKSFVNDDAGGNYALIDIAGDDQAAASVGVKLQTSEDGITYTDVGSAFTVVPKGHGALSGATGKYTRVLSSSGADIVHVVLKLRSRAQVVTSL